MIKHYLLYFLSLISCSQKNNFLIDNSIYIIYDKEIKKICCTEHSHECLKIEFKEVENFKKKYNIKDTKYLVRPQLYKIDIKNYEFKQMVISAYGESDKKLFAITVESEENKLYITNIERDNPKDNRKQISMFYNTDYKCMDDIPFAIVLGDSIDEEVRLDKSLEYSKIFMLFKDIKEYINSVYTSLKKIYCNAEGPIKKTIYDEFKQILFSFDTIRMMTCSYYDSFLYESSILEGINRQSTFESHYLAEMTKEMIEMEFLERKETLFDYLKCHYESVFPQEIIQNLINLSITESRDFINSINLSFDSLTIRDSRQDGVFRHKHVSLNDNVGVTFNFLKKFVSIFNDFCSLEVFYYNIKYYFYLDQKFNLLFNEMDEIVFENIEDHQIFLIRNIENFTRLNLCTEFFSTTPTNSITEAITNDEAFKALSLEEIVENLKSIKELLVPEIEKFTKEKSNLCPFTLEQLTLYYNKLCRNHDEWNEVLSEYNKYSKYKLDKFCAAVYESIKN